VKDVLFVAAVSCEENTVLLKDVSAEDETEAAAVWNDRAILRDGFLNRGGVGIGGDMNDLTACFPFEDFVNFGDFSDWQELSEGRFLVTCKETCLLAWKSVCAGLEDGEGDCGGDWGVSKC
jgi:hypothetical protein